MTRLIPTLALGALLAGAALAGRPDPSELLWNAESAYRQGDLEHARSLALEATQLDAGLPTLGARRLLVEIALRTDRLDDAQRAIDAFDRVPGLPESERAWLERARLRQLAGAALMSEDFATVAVMITQLQTQRGLMLPAEQAWLAWTRTRLDALTSSAFGRYDEVEKALKGSQAPNSPEAEWRDAMLWNVALHKAEASCSWPKAKKATRSLESAHGADPYRRRWAEAGAARIVVREAVSRSDTASAQRALNAMSDLPALAASDLAWAKGYSAWLERQLALKAGGEAPAGVVEASTAWQEMFPGETGCEANHLSSPWVESSSLSQRAPAPVDTARRAPTSIQNDFSVAAGALFGAATCRDATERWEGDAGDPEEGSTDEAPSRQRTPAFGATVDATWTPLSLGVPPRMGASLDASMLMMGSGLTMFDTWIGPSLAWDRLVLTVGGGGRSASRTNDDNMSCEGICPKSGDPVRQQFINGYLGVEGRSTLRSRLDLSGRAGGGAPINNGFNRVFVASGTVRWTPTPESPFYIGVAANLTMARHQGSLGATDDAAEHRTTESWAMVSIALRHEERNP